MLGLKFQNFAQRHVLKILACHERNERSADDNVNVRPATCLP